MRKNLRKYRNESNERNNSTKMNDKRREIKDKNERNEN